MNENIIKHIVHKRTSDILVNGNPKLPQPEQIAYGELAINFAKDVETISFKNTNNEIVTIPTETQINNKLENIKNEIPEEVYIGEELEGTPDLFIDTTSNVSIDIYTKEQIDEITNELNNKINNITSPDAGVISVNGMTGIVNLEIPSIDGLVTNEQFQNEVNSLNDKINNVKPELPENIVTTVNGKSGDVEIEIPSIEGLVNQTTFNDEINKINTRINDLPIPELPENIVNTINGKSGDVEIEIPNIDNLTTKDELIETELTFSEAINDLNQRINNLPTPELPENIVNTINGQSGDVTITIPNTDNFATKSELNTLSTKLSNKQDTLIPGNNVTITNSKTIDVIGYTYNPINSLHSGTNCSTNYAHTYAFGEGLSASNANQFLVGSYNNNNYSHWGDKPLMIIGAGSSSSRRTTFISQINTGNLLIAGNLQQNNGCNFAEYFEWADGNPNNEDRVGYMVSTDGEKLIIATTIEDCIGVVTGTGAFIGDAASVEWKDRFLRDEWGRVLTEEVNGEIKQIENPNYDPEREYIPRMYRKEWSPVGLVGRVYTRQDGTLTVNGYATCMNGVATKADKGYKVLKIVNENIAILLIK